MAALGGRAWRAGEGPGGVVRVGDGGRLGRTDAATARRRRPPAARGWLSLRARPCLATAGRRGTNLPDRGPAIVVRRRLVRVARDAVESRARRVRHRSRLLGGT